MGDVSIRSARESDAQSIKWLNQQIFQFEFDCCEPTSNLDFPESEEGLEYYAKVAEGRDGHHGLVAELSGKIVGYAAVKEIPDSEMTHRVGVKMAQLHTLSVNEQCRDKGIGRLLVEASKSLARDLGCNRMKVIAYAPNDRARYLYRDCGFAEHEVTHEASLD